MTDLFARMTSQQRLSLVFRTLNVTFCVALIVFVMR